VPVGPLPPPPPPRPATQGGRLWVPHTQVINKYLPGPADRPGADEGEHPGCVGHDTKQAGIPRCTEACHCQQGRGAPGDPGSEPLNRELPERTSWGTGHSTSTGHIGERRAATRCCDATRRVPPGGRDSGRPHPHKNGWEGPASTWWIVSQSEAAPRAGDAALNHSLYCGSQIATKRIQYTFYLHAICTVPMRREGSTPTRPSSGVESDGSRMTN